MNICPRKAVQAWVTRISLICYFLFAGLTIYLNVPHFIPVIIVSAAIFPLYWLFIKAIQVPFINRLFTFTSLTRYWKRYLAVNVRLADLKKNERT
jgi:hypothetical protein